MPHIQTVLGDIPPSDLGRTLLHEHLLTSPPPHITDEDFLLDSEAKAASELHALKKAGANALLEMSPRDYGRNPHGLARLSRATGVHIIMVTGWMKERIFAPYVAGRGQDDLAQEMIHELSVGVGGIKAGAIKAGSSLDEITEAEALVMRSAAQASLATGALITTHTEAGTMGLEQIELFTQAGVSPERLLIGHADRKLDFAYHLAMVKTGATIGYDQIGKTKYYPDEERLAMLLRLAEAGYAHRIALSTDFARRSNWPSYGGSPGTASLLTHFIPLLEKAGLDSTLFLEETPRRLLAMG
jgi:phosphotriesterase-related protein